MNFKESQKILVPPCQYLGNKAFHCGVKGEVTPPLLCSG